MRFLKTNFIRLPSDALIQRRVIQHTRTYGFGVSSVSLSTFAVISSGPSEYCEYDVNGHSIIAML